MFRLIYMRFRAMGRWYWVVPLALWVAFPLLAYLFYSQEGGSGYYYTAMYLESMGCLFSSWWLCLGLKEENEGSGCEVLRMYCQKTARRLWGDLSFLLWYMLHLAVVGAVLLQVDTKYAVPVLTMAVEVVWLFGVCYALIGLLRKTSIPLMLALGYVLAGQLIDQPLRYKLTIFSEPYVTLRQAGPKYTALLLVGAVLCAVGFFLQKRRL